MPGDAAGREGWGQIVKCFEGSAETSQFIPRTPGSHCKSLSRGVMWPDVYYGETTQNR